MLSLFTVVESELLKQDGLEKSQRGSTSTVQNTIQPMIPWCHMFGFSCIWERINFIRFEPCPAFYHCLLCIPRFLAKSCVHTWIFGQKSRIHAGFLPESTHTRRFLARFLDASFVTRDCFFIDFSLKLLLVIYPFLFFH